MRNPDSSVVFGPMRLPFLILPPACVALGTATAVWSGSEIKLFYLALAFIGAVTSHICVNALNEYSDFKSGQTGLPAKQGEAAKSTRGRVGKGRLGRCRKDCRMIFLIGWWI